MSHADVHSWLAISEGRVIGIVVEDRSRAAMDAFAEWRADPSITELVRMSVEAARRFYMQPWPGREAALAMLEQEAANG